MKERHAQYVQSGLGILISIVVVYACLAARSACCSPGNTGLPTFDTLSGFSVGSSAGTTLAPQNRHARLRADIGRIIYPAGCGAANACCRTEHRPGFGQAVHVNFSVSRSLYPVHKNPILYFAPCIVPSAFKSSGLPQASFKPLPLYILGQTILC